MSCISEGRDYLLATESKLDEVVGVCSRDEDPEELAQILRAKELEDEAEQLLAAASVAPTPAEAAALAAAAHELFLQAEGLRRAAKEGLEARYGQVAGTLEEANGVRNMIVAAAEDTRMGGELLALATGLIVALEEVQESLGAAASMATERGETDKCIGLINLGREQNQTAAGHCKNLQGKTSDYVALLA